MAAALVLWMMVDRPAALISSDGTLVGLMGPEGRALSSPRGAGFTARSWLEDDGDLTAPQEAALRPGFSGPKGARAFQIAGLRGEVLAGKAALDEVAAACGRADVVVVPASLGEVEPVPGCLIIDRGMLDRSGALALHPVPGGVRLEPVRQVARIWLGARPVQPELILAPADRRISSCGSDQPACPAP